VDFSEKSCDWLYLVQLENSRTYELTLSDCHFWAIPDGTAGAKNMFVWSWNTFEKSPCIAGLFRTWFLSLCDSVLVETVLPHWLSSLADKGFKKRTSCLPVPLLTNTFIPDQSFGCWVVVFPNWLYLLADEALWEAFSLDSLPNVFSTYCSIPGFELLSQWHKDWVVDCDSESLALIGCFP